MFIAILSHLSIFVLINTLSSLNLIFSIFSRHRSNQIILSIHLEQILYKCWVFSHQNHYTIPLYLLDLYKNDDETDLHKRLTIFI